MLRYLNSGKREFGRWPLGPFHRPNWEFYAVLKGRCGLLLPDETKLPLQERRLWIFPPHHVHGWYGDPDQPCEVAVFHFNTVPHILERFIRENPLWERALHDEHCRQIEEMARALEPDYRHPTSLSHVRTDRVLLDLTLLILQDQPTPTLPTAEHHASEKVDAALAWFKTHLSERPTVEDLAAAVHVSPTRLRRLFAQVREESPRHAMNEIRLRMASRLLAETDEKLDFIASRCGYSNGSNFARDFKARRGVSPSQWRKRTLDYAKTLEAIRQNPKPNTAQDRS